MPAKKPNAKKTVKTTVKKQVGTSAKTSSKKKKSESVVADPVEPPPSPKPTELKIPPTKGRPMLHWVGKKPLNRVTAFPAQLAESFDPCGELETVEGVKQTGNLYYGDNKEVLAYLLANGYRGSVDLIYIDPPFDSGVDYVRKVTLRGKSGVSKKEMVGEQGSFSEQIQYSDIWKNDSYLQFMYERLILLKELLTEGGSFFLHCDQTASHLLRCLLDEVFGPEAFRNELVWYYSNKYGANSQTFDAFHNTIFWYSKGKLPRFTPIRVPVKEKRMQPVRAWNKELGKNEWLRDENGEYRYQESAEKDMGDVWEVPVINPMALERSGYPTQKPEQLIAHILNCATAPGALVLDCFIGSGTTAAVAQKLGRRWIGCDINKGAIQTTSKRLQGIIRDQLAEHKEAAAKAKGDLFGGETDGEHTVTPCSFSFRIQRVNDYDLAIQHNEAVALACEHIGVQRTKTDSYFDGTQGKRLVKIIPFNHPLSPADLEQLKGELKAREKEERDILLVCLGKELACETWLADWNRLRKRGDVPNKIEIIELRTDPKYGKFMTHTPASAKVSVKRKGDEIHVTIADFTSPTIIERLDSQDSRLFTAQVTDWRFMVDCVMIDPEYDGRSFNIALTDVPERKTDLVSGNYVLPAPVSKATVAVKIVDMLGEEVVVFTDV